MPLRHWALAGLIVAGLVTRIPFAGAGLFEFAPTRQHFSALIARAAYLESVPDAPLSRKAAVDDYMDFTIEPDPGIAESIAAFAFRLRGGEDPAIARLLSSIWWVAGALPLWCISRRLSGDAGAIAATTLYLLLPFAILAGRSFQPDPLAVLLMLLAAWRLGRWQERPGFANALGAAALAGAAILVRAPVACFLVPFAAVLWWSRRATTPGWTTPIAFALLALGPTAAYYVSLWAFEPGFADATASRLDVRLWVSPSFWIGWARMVHYTFSLPVMVIAVASAAAARGQERAWLWPLWCGYALYGLVFPFHISTHAYYQTLAVPVVALSVGALAARLPARSMARPGVAMGAAIGLLIWIGVSGVLSPLDQSAARDIYRSIGGATNHSLRVVFLTENWATPLRYHGEISGRSWPTRGQVAAYQDHGEGAIPDVDAAARLAALDAELGGAEFFAITDLDEFARQADLIALLDDVPVHARGDGYVVYDLRIRRSPL